MFDGMKNNGYSNIVLKTFGENSDNNLLKTMFTNGSIIYLQYVVLTVDKHVGASTSSGNIIPKHKRSFSINVLEDMETIIEAYTFNTEINNMPKLPINFGDYWHFIKTQNYKCLNYKYNAIDDNYKCSGLNDKCKGKLNYSKGFIIEEKDQHNCVSEHPIYLRIKIRVLPTILKRNSTCYCIHMHYKYENGFKVQFVGSQMFGQDYNEYKIMVSSQMNCYMDRKCYWGF